MNLFSFFRYDYDYGTHVTGIACGNGNLSGGKYIGIAPESNIISLKVLDEDGRGNSADVLAALQWIADNKDLYNIRVVNLSVGTPDIGSLDPLVKAVEKIWTMGVVVIAAAGNNGPKYSSVTSPGISRKIITVGASDDDLGSVGISGNRLINFSGRGPTSECIVKPDILAPGTNIISTLSKEMTRKNYNSHKSRIVDNYYLSLSGTSMSTPIVTGAVALFVEKHPHLTPDDVKYNLKLSSETIKSSGNQSGWNLLNTEKLLTEEVKYVRKKSI